MLLPASGRDFNWQATGDGMDVWCMHLDDYGVVIAG